MSDEQRSASASPCPGCEAEDCDVHDDEGRPRRPGWSHGKDRSGGVRTIYQDGENVGQMLSGAAIELIETLRPGSAFLWERLRFAVARIVEPVGEWGTRTFTSDEPTIIELTDAYLATRAESSKPGGSTDKASDDVELDSPNFVSEAAKDLAARDFQRVNRRPSEAQCPAITPSGARCTLRAYHAFDHEERPVCGAELFGMPGAYQRCELPVGHDGDHRDGIGSWPHLRRVSVEAPPMPDQVCTERDSLIKNATCSRCVGIVPQDGVEHIVDSDGDVVCRAEVLATDSKRTDKVLRRALGRDLWNRLWGPELEHLGGAVDALIEERIRESARPNERQEPDPLLATDAAKGSLPSSCDPRDAVVAAARALDLAMKDSWGPPDEEATTWDAPHDEVLALRKALETLKGRSDP